MYQQHGFDGIGFVLSSGDPFCGIDLDSCRDSETGEIEEWVQKIIDGFAGAYIDVSPSGTGLHIITRGELDGDGKNTKTVEMYDMKRFFTVTGVTI